MEPRVEWPQALTREFIHLYRDSACLWDTSVVEYRNKSCRDSALASLLILTRRVFHDADIDFIRRKINILRTMFRKEYNRVIKSNSGDGSVPYGYKPKLWCYEDLSFLAYQERLTDTSGGKVSKASHAFDLADSISIGSNSKGFDASVVETIKIDPDEEKTRVRQSDSTTDNFEVRADRSQGQLETNTFTTSQENSRLKCSPTNHLQGQTAPSEVLDCNKIKSSVSYVIPHEKTSTIASSLSTQNKTANENILAPNSSLHNLCRGTSDSSQTPSMSSPLQDQTPTPISSLRHQILPVSETTWFQNTNSPSNSFSDHNPTVFVDARETSSRKVMTGNLSHSRGIKRPLQPTPSSSSISNRNITYGRGLGIAEQTPANNSSENSRCQATILVSQADEGHFSRTVRVQNQRPTELPVISGAHSIQNREDHAGEAEDEIFGKMVSMELRRITDARQKLFVRKIINDALFQGQVHGLNLSSHIRTSDQLIPDSSRNSPRTSSSWCGDMSYNETNQ